MLLSRTALLVDGDRVALIGREPNGALRSIACAAIGGSIDDGSPPSVEAVLAVAVPLLRAAAVRRVVLALPSSWVEHLVVQVPPARRLDDLALLLREVTRSTRLEASDVAFAVSGGKREAKKPSRLLVAARESTVLEMARGLTRAGIAVTRITSSGAEALLAIGARAGEVRGASVAFLLRRSGFAIAVHLDRELLQHRVVQVALPADGDVLARVLAEEVRRAAVFVRERRQGRELAEIVLGGAVDGAVGSDGGEALRAGLERLTGVPTSTVAPLSESADLELEAEALLAPHPSATLDLLPRGALPTPRVALARGAMIAAGVVCAALVVLGAQRIDASTLDAEREAAGNDAMAALVDPLREKRDAIALRIDAFEARRDALAAAQDSQVDLPRLLAALAASLPPHGRIERITCDARLDAPRTVRVEGRLLDSYWQYEPLVERLAIEVSRRSGMSFEVAPVDPERRGADVQDFALIAATAPEVDPESAGS
jgi:hypothetical protein